jgi:serine/threonine protein kinase
MLALPWGKADLQEGVVSELASATCAGNAATLAAAEGSSRLPDTDIPMDVTSAIGLNPSAHSNEVLCPGPREFSDVVTAVAALHSIGIIHMDLRPENFYRDAKGVLFIGDFGSAVSRGSKLDPTKPFGLEFASTRILTAIATGAVIAPEPEDDYEMLAHVAFACTASNHVHHALLSYRKHYFFGDTGGVGDSKSRASLLLEMWKMFESTTILGELQQAAQEAAGGADKQKRFVALISQLVPGPAIVPVSS